MLSSITKYADATAAAVFIDLASLPAALLLDRVAVSMYIVHVKLGYLITSRITPLNYRLGAVSSSERRATPRSAPPVSM